VVHIRKGHFGDSAAGAMLVRSAISTVVEVGVGVAEGATSLVAEFRARMTVKTLTLGRTIVHANAS
jgi:hypothetical protein